MNTQRPILPGMDIHPIDLHFQAQPEIIAAFLLEDAGELALIETGPSSTLPTLTEAIRRLGHDPAEIKKVLLTHIHLDHAGAAGWWAEQGAEVYVHERGARHLADPSRLLDGARQVYGAQMETLWGEVRPVPEPRLHVLRDGDTVKVGRQTLTAWDTPGHARHHHVFLLDDVIFTGDVAGVRLPGCRYLSPTTAPSQFDPEEYAASLERLIKARPRRLYLTHFGPVDDPASHLERYAAAVREASDLIRHALERGEKSPHELYTRHQHEKALAEGASEAQWRRYETANPSNMCTDGMVLYWHKHLKQTAS